MQRLRSPTSAPPRALMPDKLDSKQRSALMARVKQRDTEPELKVRSLLHQAGRRFRLSKPKLPGRPDIIFVSKRKVIFVHGCFWHGHACRRGKLPSSNVDYWTAKIARNQGRDDIVRIKLNDLGWSSMIVWECELRDISTLSLRLSDFLD
jgi:DNA mismatch endonuclease (patch repair protein)